LDLVFKIAPIPPESPRRSRAEEKSKKERKEKNKGSGCVIATGGQNQLLHYQLEKDAQGKCCPVRSIGLK